MLFFFYSAHLWLLYECYEFNSILYESTSVNISWLVSVD